MVYVWYPPNSTNCVSELIFCILYVAKAFPHIQQLLYKQGRCKATVFVISSQLLAQGKFQM